MAEQRKLVLGSRQGCGAGLGAGIWEVWLGEGDSCKATQGLSFAFMQTTSMAWTHQPERPGCHKGVKSSAPEEAAAPSETA